MQTRFRTAAITDEFTPDIDRATAAMAEAGLTGAELRVIDGKNIMDLTDAELDRAIAICRARGLEIISIASPLLKCVLPGGGDVDSRFQQDSFAARHTYEDQPRLARRAFEIAHRTGARIIRVFTFWRTVNPKACFSRIAESLCTLAADAAREDVLVGIENEHACNIGTGAETARILEAVSHPNLLVVWDPANCLVAGENPYPEAFRQLPAARIAHVHAKDCTLEDGQPKWCPLGEGSVDWPGQFEALGQAGYQGWVSLETHWPGPGGDKFRASVICAANLRRLLQ